MPCDGRCWKAKSDPSKCRCECEGRNHGSQRNDDKKDKDKENWWDIVLTDEEARIFRDQFTRRNQCSCGYNGLHDLDICGYKPHEAGWTIRGEKYWLFIHCPKCNNDWSIWKLGAGREVKQKSLKDFV